jgi:hypothetical protein
MKFKAFLFTKKEFIKDKKFISNEKSDKLSIIIWGFIKKEAIKKFVKRKKSKDWETLKKQDWVIKKVTVKIK